MAPAKFQGEGLLVDTWVMSCRAFSRRIEHQTLQACYSRRREWMRLILLFAHGKERSHAGVLRRRCWAKLRKRNSV